MTFGVAKFQVHVKEWRGEGGGGVEMGVRPERPVDVKRGKSEYVDGPFRMALLIFRVLSQCLA